MNQKRLRIQHTAREASFKRAQLLRRLRSVKQEITPSTLLDRGRQHVDTAVDTAVDRTSDVVGEKLSRYRLILGLITIVGLGYALRKPVMRWGPVVLEACDDMMASFFTPGRETLEGSEEQLRENNDEVT